MASFVERIAGAAKLRAEVFEEVEADKNAMGQAVAVVLGSSIAAGIGMGPRGGLDAVAGGLIGALAGWIVWAFLIYLIGAKLFPQPQTRSDMGEMLRTIGFASSPGLIRIFGILPGFTNIVFLVSAFWMLAAMIISVRQALDYTSILRAAGVCLVGWLVQLLLFWFFLYFIGGPRIS